MSYHLLSLKSFSHLFYKERPAHALAWLTARYDNKNNKPLYDLLFDVAFKQFGDLTECPASDVFKRSVSRYANLATTWLASQYMPGTKLHEQLSVEAMHHFGELAELRHSSAIKQFVRACLESSAFKDYQDNYDTEVQQLNQAKSAKLASDLEKASAGWSSFFATSVAALRDDRDSQDTSISYGASSSSY